MSAHRQGVDFVELFEPQPLAAAEHWMAGQRALWERRLDQLDNYLLQLKEETK